MHEDREDKALDYRIVGQLVIDGCCSFRVWQHGAATTVEVGKGCASCVAKLENAIPAPGGSPEYSA